MLSLIFILTIISTVGSAEAGIVCTKFFEGDVDGVTWSIPANWNDNTLPTEEVDDICVDAAPVNSDVVLDIDYSLGFRSLLISSGDTLTVAENKALRTLFDTIFIDPGATLIVRGALEDDTGLVINHGLLQVCIETGSIAELLVITGNPPEFIKCEQSVGGEIIPTETTSLLLAGAQSTTWLIPVTVSIIGIGVFVVSRKPENS